MGFKNDFKGAFLMVANVETYGNLQATLYFVHLFFPDIPIVVYDLGLNDEMRAKVNIFLSRFYHRQLFCSSNSDMGQLSIESHY